jgi:hypothetical protein
LIWFFNFDIIVLAIWTGEVFQSLKPELFREMESSLPRNFKRRAGKDEGRGHHRTSFCNWDRDPIIGTEGRWRKEPLKICGGTSVQKLRHAFETATELPE